MQIQRIENELIIRFMEIANKRIQKNNRNKRVNINSN